MKKVTDKETIIKLFQYLSGQAEQGHIKSIVAIKNWMHINYEKPKPKTDD